MVECANSCKSRHSKDGILATAATCDGQQMCWCSIELKNSTVFESIDALVQLEQEGSFTWFNSINLNA